MGTGPIIVAMAKESPVDELFQLPLGDFTAARNAMAKSAGKHGAAIRELPKPPLASWAVNQLYWKDRDQYELLIQAASEVRRTHKAVIEGKRGDLRSAGREHDAALDAALKSTVVLLKKSGTPVTDATRHAILNTLRALPSDEAPGRLTRALAPGGFEMLAGITPAAVPTSRGKTAKTTRNTTERERDPKKTEPKSVEDAARARDQRAAADSAVREADQQARHAEFEAARATREATKAQRRVEEARKGFDEARKELEIAEREATRAAQHSETANRRSREAQAALGIAKSKLFP